MIFIYLSYCCCCHGYNLVIFPGCLYFWPLNYYGFLYYSDLTQICIQFLFYIWEYLLFFFLVFLLQNFYILIPISYSYTSLSFSYFYPFVLLIYSGNAIQVCPTYYSFDFSTKLPLFYWKTSFLSSDYFHWPLLCLIYYVH